MQRNALEYARRDGLLAEDEQFYAQQNAQTVRNAEVYYRAMFGGRVTSWNLRDQHMAQTLQALLAHLDRHGGPEPARIVVWAHNSHVGDARATEVGTDGQLTLGQLVRERYGDDSRLIGFTTYSGTVTAASEWGGIAERKVVRPALNGSVEELFHETGRPAFLVSAMISRDAAEPLDVVRLGRAIGVIYLPATERQSHYYHVRPSEQFDAIIHIEKTRALEPLETTSLWVDRRDSRDVSDWPVTAQRGAPRPGTRRAGGDSRARRDEQNAALLRDPIGGFLSNAAASDGGVHPLVVGDDDACQRDPEPVGQARRGSRSCRSGDDHVDLLECQSGFARDTRPPLRRRHARSAHPCRPIGRTEHIASDR